MTEMMRGWIPFKQETGQTSPGKVASRLGEGRRETRRRWARCGRGSRWMERQGVPPVARRETIRRQNLLLVGVGVVKKIIGG